MSKKYLLFVALFLIALSLFIYGCKSETSSTGPDALLDDYFSSAVKQDYAKVYNCYYKQYREKISLDEYVRHRQQASVLQNYKIISLKQNGNTARAEVFLTFAPSKKFSRTKPITVKVTEDLVKENGQWKIKVW